MSAIRRKPPFSFPVIHYPITSRGDDGEILPSDRENVLGQPHE